MLNSTTRQERTVPAVSAKVAVAVVAKRPKRRRLSCRRHTRARSYAAPRLRIGQCLRRALLTSLKRCTAVSSPALTSG